MPDVCLITPTRDRPEAVALCARWMRRQTFAGGVQWLIIDDGDKPVDMEALASWFPWQETENWKITHVRREPSEAAHTLTQNLLAAIERVEAPIVLIIEDDEHYAPVYIEEMVWRLREADLAGECKARYYNVVERRWSVMTDNSHHASLCRTAFRDAVLPAFKAIVEFCQSQSDPFVDMILWNAANPGRLVGGTVAAGTVLQDAKRPWAAAANWKPTGRNAPQTSPQAPPPPYPRSQLVVPQRPDQTPAQARLMPNLKFLPSTTRISLFEGRGISVGIKGMPGRGGIGRAHASRAFGHVDPHWAKLIEWIGPDAAQYMELAKRLEWRPVL